MKNSLIACFLIIGLTASAQHKTPEERAKTLTDTMSAKLSLTEDAYKKVYDINLAFVTKSAALKKEDRDKSTKMTEMRTIGSERDTALKAVLSEEQYKEFKELKKENRKAMRGKLRNKA
jgi:hypothetical protein